MPIVTIAFVPIPTHMIMSGPSAILGKEFRIMIYGSRTFFSGGITYNIIATTVPINVLNIKAKIVSFKVVNICVNSEPES